MVYCRPLSPNGRPFSEISAGASQCQSLSGHCSRFLLVLALAFRLARRGRQRDHHARTNVVRRTQELFDREWRLGNQAPWKQYFAEDTVYFDAEGAEHGQRPRWWRMLRRLPKGYIGKYQACERPPARINDRTGTSITYDLDETEIIYGATHDSTLPRRPITVADSRRRAA